MFDFIARLQPCKGGVSRLLGFFLVLACIFLSTCSSRLGWGILLWSTDDPPIPSGMVLPVYIRSNISKQWVIGLPEGWKNSRDGIDKIEVPLAHFELVGSKKKALERAQEFSRYAQTYAENLQDGLPIRDNPDNNARRVYRLRVGEVVKILSAAKGVPAISATGEPLPGDWYRVLAEDGSTGYCFSYRLKLFEHTGGALAAAVPELSENPTDPDLDALMSKAWSPESYSTMVNLKRVNLNELSRRWHFDPGQETGTARIYIPGIDQSFPYTGIRPDGAFAWRFEGTSLGIQMRSSTVLAVHFVENSSATTAGSQRTLIFVSLPITVDDLIIQETARRERLYKAIHSQGPIFTSNNYGTIAFGGDETFVWQGYNLLVPQYIGASVEGRGTISMDLFLGSALENRYNGAFTMRFAGSGGAVLRCMYVLDNQGFRIEIVPESSVEDITVVRRASSPMVLYFFKDSASSGGALGTVGDGLW